MSDMRPGGFPHWQRVHPIYYGPRRFRLFHRLFWFALGAGAATMWSRHHEKERAITSGPDGHNGEWRHWSGNRFGCHRHREQSQQPPAHEWATGPPSMQPAQPFANVSAAAPYQTPPQVPTAPTAVAEPVRQSKEWHAESISEAGKLASAAMADMSENALDALMANIQALKAKIAEGREGREKERLYLEQRIPTDAPNRRDESGRLV